jgi:repressor of nif and glnA expression
MKTEKEIIENNNSNKSENTEIEALKEALAKKDKELSEINQQVRKKDQEKEEIRKVLKDEEEKGLLRKYGFSVEELDNIRLMGGGEITEAKLQELKQKALQRKNNAFISLLQDENHYKSEQSEPWEKQINHIKTHPKGKIR